MGRPARGAQRSAVSSHFFTTLFSLAPPPSAMDAAGTEVIAAAVESAEEAISGDAAPAEGDAVAEVVAAAEEGVAEALDAAAAAAEPAAAAEGAAAAAAEPAAEEEGAAAAAEPAAEEAKEEEAA